MLDIISDLLYAVIAELVYLSYNIKLARIFGYFSTPRDYSVRLYQISGLRKLRG